MSFIEIFKEQITFPECRVVCWESDGCVMEHTDIPILFEPVDEFLKRKNEVVDISKGCGNNLGDNADEIIKHAATLRPCIASERIIQAAANLHLAIERIETAIEAAYKFAIGESIAVAYPESSVEHELTATDRIEFNSAKWNLNLIKDFCAYYISDRQYAVNNFWKFRYYIHHGNHQLYNVPFPMQYNSGEVCTSGDHVDFHREFNKPDEQIAYSVSNFYEYCFALLDYLCNNKCRLEKCKRCGRYYVPKGNVRNSSYCRTIDLELGKSCLELSKNRNIEFDKEFRQIYNMLYARCGSNAEEDLRTFVNDNRMHRQRVARGSESTGEYRQWLSQEYNRRCIRPRKQINCSAPEVI